VPGYIKEKIWHESQEIHPQDDGSILFEAEVAGTDEVKFWIMSWGSHALVLEPESLRNEMKAEAKRVIGNYEREAKHKEGVKQEENPLMA
jgi:predicted DNA-binding transcriptional regulator YafY